MYPRPRPERRRPPLAASRRRSRRLVRGGFEPVVERPELRRRAEAAGEGEGGQVIGKPGVLGQQRTVDVGAEQVGAVHALEAVAAVVAEALDHATERLGPGAEPGAAAVILKARDYPRPGPEVDLDRHVSDQSRALLAHGLEVDQPEAGDPLFVELVAVAKELITAADGEQDGAAVDRCGDRVALARQHVGGDDALVAILPAADVDQVVGVGVDRLAGPGGSVLEADPPPLTTTLKEEHVAAVGVDVHLLGVQRQQSQLHHAASKTTMVEPTWSSVGGTSIRSRLVNPTTPASASSRAAVSESRCTESTCSRRLPVGETSWRSRLTSIPAPVSRASIGRLEYTQPARSSTSGSGG